MSQSDEPLGFVLVDVARLFRQRLEEALADAGLELTPGEARALYHLASRGPMRQSRLAESMSLEPMTLVGYLDRLEAAGLVRRTPDPDDRRAKQVGLTAAADGLLPRIRAIATAVRSSATRGIEPPDLERLRSDLLLLRQNLDPSTEDRRT